MSTQPEICPYNTKLETKTTAQISTSTTAPRHFTQRGWFHPLVSSLVLEVHTKHTLTMSDEVVTLISSEAEKFEVAQEVAFKSETIKNMIEGE